MNVKDLESYFEQHKAAFFADWSRFLSFQSVSADSAHNADCISCAEWLREQLNNLGFTTRTIETSGKPLVFAERAGKGGLPTVLFYGHYDVQPVDPLDKWVTPPFEPTWRGERLYARGAQDNKGQVSFFLSAVKSLIELGKLECPLKILIEGEEETSSRGIAEMLPALQKELAADVLMVCDTGTFNSESSVITMGLRGIVALEVRLKGPNYDLHSGVHGGVVRNPATEIARLVATLHRADGSIAVDGFYDDVAVVDPEDQKLANQVPLNPESYKAMIGVEPLGGESSYTMHERRGLRPTLEVNGIYGGYAGEGGKTIIPAYAGVKLTARLVKGQDPERVVETILTHCQKNTPRGVSLEVVAKEVAGPAVALSAHSSIVRAARDVLEQVTPGKNILMWEGASIPIVTGLAKASGATPLMVGYGMEEDQIHAPNESFSAEQFRKGFLYAGLMLHQLSQSGNT